MKALLWDFDGTLATRMGRWSGTLSAIAKKAILNCQISAEQIRPFLHTGFPWHAPELIRPYNSADQWWAELVPVFANAYQGVGLAHVVAENLAKQVRAAYLEISEWQVFDDVAPTLASLASHGWQHYILSNHVPELPELVEKLGLAQYFFEIWTSACTGYEKPHVEAFKMPMRFLSGSTEIWMIGDSLTADVLGAERVGIPAILVRQHHPSARHCCNSLVDVVRILSEERGKI